MFKHTWQVWQSIIYYAKLQFNLNVKVYIESEDRSTFILKKTKAELANRFHLGTKSDCLVVAAWSVNVQ